MKRIWFFVTVISALALLSVACGGVVDSLEESIEAKGEQLEDSVESEGEALEDSLDAQGDAMEADLEAEGEALEDSLDLKGGALEDELEAELEAEEDAMEAAGDASPEVCAALATLDASIDAIGDLDPDENSAEDYQAAFDVARQDYEALRQVAGNQYAAPLDNFGDALAEFETDLTSSGEGGLGGLLELAGATGELAAAGEILDEAIGCPVQ